MRYSFRTDPCILLGRGFPELDRCPPERSSAGTLLKRMPESDRVNIEEFVLRKALLT